MGRIKRVDQTKRIKIHDTGYRAPDTVFASNYEIRRGSRRRDLYRYEIWKELIYLIYFFLFCVCIVVIYSVYRVTVKNC